MPRSGYVISGHVLDPHDLRPEDALLMVVRNTSETGSEAVPVHVQPDGAFTTRPLAPGTYALKVVRTPDSATKRATVVAFTVVDLIAANVSNVAVEIRRDTAIVGTFRMESDTPNPRWPPHIAVQAWLALDRAPSLDTTVAEGAPAGQFVLRNAFGPRVLRCGYTIAPGDSWRQSRVMLDGVDVTDVPTDFSEHEGGRLEIVFTR